MLLKWNILSCSCWQLSTSAAAHIMSLNSMGVSPLPPRPPPPTPPSPARWWSSCPNRWSCAPPANRPGYLIIWNCKPDKFENVKMSGLTTGRSTQFLGEMADHGSIQYSGTTQNLSKWKFNSKSNRCPVYKSYLTSIQTLSSCGPCGTANGFFSVMFPRRVFNTGNNLWNVGITL